MHHDLIDARTVGRFTVVGRLINIPRSQRIPAHIGRAADTDRYIPAGFADPGDQRRRIDRAYDALARPPAPAAADHDPTAVMERREAPGRIVDPGPAPGRNPAPAAVAVRHPAHLHHARIPDRAIGRVGRPIAVGVEVFVAGHVRRDIARGAHFLHLLVTATRPFVERGAVGRAVGKTRSARTDIERLTGRDRQRIGGRLQACPAAEHGDAHRLALTVVDPVPARRLQIDAQAAGGHREAVVAVFAQAHIEAAVFEVEHRFLVTDAAETAARLCAHAQGMRPPAHLGARFRAGDEAGGYGDHIIDLGGIPGAFVVLLGAPDLHIAIGDRHPRRDLGRGWLGVGLIVGRQRRRDEDAAGQQPSG